uniref:Uncharacterized protein n=1 Tax=Panagrolaimus sp. JU765 TaxID=591449 RepID=A0AC34Q9E9_9BILA
MKLVLLCLALCAVIFAVEQNKNKDPKIVECLEKYSAEFGVIEQAVFDEISGLNGGDPCKVFYKYVPQLKPIFVGKCGFSEQQFDTVVVPALTPNGCNP